jgi:hypothetical protein
MKKLLSILAVFILLGFTAQAKPVNPPAGFGIFFSTLNPHGQWIELDYGMVVWRPTIIRRGWAPYRDGHWVWTYDGWYWESYEPFGHVTYHYGRWFYDDYYGWMWVPDYEWAPSWVEWRYDDAYIGWAPLPPYATFSINIGIHYTHNYYTPYHHWHFVRYRHFHEPYVYRHFVGGKYKNKIYSKTKYRTNYAYNDGRVVNRGVDVDYVRQRSGRDIRPREIERIRDNSTFERNRSGGERGNSNEKIRTLYIPKDELQRDRDRDRELIRNDVKRSDRKTNLEISKVELSGVRDTKRNENTDRDRINDREAVRDRDIKTERTPVDANRGGRNDGNVTTPPVQRNNEEVRKEVKVNERSPVRETKNERTTPNVQERRTEEVKSTRKNESKEVREVPVPQNRTNRSNTVEQKPVERTRNSNDVNVRQNKTEEKKRTESNVQRENRSNERTQVKRETQRTETRTEKNVEREKPSNDRNKQERRR